MPAEEEITWLALEWLGFGFEDAYVEEWFAKSMKVRDQNPSISRMPSTFLENVDSRSLEASFSEEEVFSALSS